MTRAAAFRVVEDFEGALAAYTGAPHVVTIDSCTNAIFLALLWGRAKGLGEPWARLPRRTYVGVGQAARNAGYRIVWSDEPWAGAYRIDTPAWLVLFDSAKRFTSGMFYDLTGRDRKVPALVAISFQAGKLLPIGRGGAILTDSAEAAAWLRKARFDGRTPGDDTAPIQVPGWHMYLTPPDAARGLWLLSWAAKDNADLPCDEYNDLSEMEAFR